MSRPTEIIRENLKTASALLNIEYSASVIVNPFDKTRNCNVVFNPDDHTNAFFNYLIDYDYMLSDLMENMRITRLSNFALDSKSKKYYYNETQYLRPCGDACYIPFFFDRTFIGFIGLVKPHGSDNFRDGDLDRIWHWMNGVNTLVNRALIEEHRDLNIRAEPGNIFIGNFFLNTERKHLTEISYEVSHLLNRLVRPSIRGNETIQLSDIIEKDFH